MKSLWLFLVMFVSAPLCASENQEAVAEIPKKPDCTKAAALLRAVNDPVINELRQVKIIAALEPEMYQRLVTACRFSAGCHWTVGTMAYMGTYALTGDPITSGVCGGLSASASKAFLGCVFRGCAFSCMARDTYTKLRDLAQPDKITPEEIEKMMEVMSNRMINRMQKEHPTLWRWR